MNEAAKRDQSLLTHTNLFAGTALFLLLGFYLILNELPHQWALPYWIDQVRLLIFLFGLILPSTGFAIAWLKDFPRWSYPYVGLTILMSLYMQNVATPGLQLAGYDLFGRELWGWRAWAPPLVAGAVGLIGASSFRPLLRLVQGVWEDWTRLTYALFGGMPLFVAALFDEMDRLYSLPFMVILTLLMVATSLLYLQSSHLKGRVLSLLLGNAAIMVIGFVAVEVHWALKHGLNTLRMTLLPILFLSVLFAPALVGVIRRSIRMTIAKNALE